MKKAPIFSVIMPVYNKEKYVTRAVKSVLSQNFEDFELIIIDDGSTDGSISEIRKIKDKRIRIYSLKRNRGASYARNAGIKKAKGDYITFLDADDEYLNGFLKNIYAVTRKYKEIKFFAAAYKKVLSSKKTEIKSLGKKNDFIVKNFLQAVSKNNFFVHISSVAVHKSVFKKTGLFGTAAISRFKTNAYGEDFDMWLRIASKFKLCYSNKPGSIYYKNTGSNITLDKQHGYNSSPYEKTLVKFIKTAEPGEKKIYQALLEKLYKRTALQHALTGSFKKAEQLTGGKMKNDKIKKLISKIKAIKRLTV